MSWTAVLKRKTQRRLKKATPADPGAGLLFSKEILASLFQSAPRAASRAATRRTSARTSTNRPTAETRPEYCCAKCQTRNWCDRSSCRHCGMARPRSIARTMGINPRRAPPGAPAARPTNAPQIKPGVQAETFRRAAADMRKAGAPPNVIEPVLAAEQEARQRLSEAKA